MRFLFLTAARRGEARELPWSEIDGTDWHLPGARNKVKVNLTRPLSKAAIGVLEGLPRVEGSPFVFTSTGAAPLHLGKPFADLQEATGIKNWRLHDIRRSSRTLLARAGVNADIAERCLGHVVGSVQRIYNRHNFHREMAEAYEKLASLIENIVHPSSHRVGKLRVV